MRIKVFYNSELLKFKNSDFTEFNYKVWNELEKEFGFSIRNATYEICPDDNLNIENVIISLNDKGYNEYKAWKYRLDRLDAIFNSLWTT